MRFRSDLMDDPHFIDRTSLLRSDRSSGSFLFWKQTCGRPSWPRGLQACRRLSSVSNRQRDFRAPFSTISLDFCLFLWFTGRRFVWFAKLQENQHQWITSITGNPLKSGTSRTWTKTGQRGQLTKQPCSSYRSTVHIYINSSGRSNYDNVDLFQPT